VSRFTKKVRLNRGWGSSFLGVKGHLPCQKSSISTNKYPLLLILVSNCPDLYHDDAPKCLGSSRPNLDTIIIGHEQHNACGGKGVGWKRRAKESGKDSRTPGKYKGEGLLAKFLGYADVAFLIPGLLTRWPC
jgi:large exoprotein involved in heme utilization and adhesion